jgi:hypothetical protein
LHDFKTKAADQNRIGGFIYSETDEPYFVISDAQASDSLKRHSLYRASVQPDGPYATSTCGQMEENLDAFYDQTLQDLNRYSNIDENFIEPFKAFLNEQAKAVKIHATTGQPTLVVTGECHPYE